MVFDTTSYAQAIGLVATLAVCLASGFDSVVAQEEIGSLGPVRRGGAEISLATFFTDKPPFAGLSGAAPRRDHIKRELLTAALWYLCGLRVCRLL